jgi:glycosyltransferase involved in cell wall biosynthesis
MAVDRVSIVVPAYEQARYLPACLDRLAWQDWPDLEIIVVADASADGTVEAAREYIRTAGPGRGMAFVTGYRDRADGGYDLVRAEAPRHPPGRRWTLIENPGRVGIYAAINQGLRRATGAWCGYVVADDLPHPEMVPALVDALDRTPADFAYSDMLLVDDAGRILRRIETLEWDYERCLCDWYRLGVSRLYRRSLHDRAGLYDVACNVGDYAMCVRFAQAGARFVRVPRALYSVRHHGEGRKVHHHSPEGERRAYDGSVAVARLARARIPGGRTMELAPK